MIRFNPTLIVKQLVVIKDSHQVYSGIFHKGVNVISGQNGAGKSLITELLFYSLGGEVRIWKYPASICDYVLVEVAINGEVATLKRAISESNPLASMEVYLGPLSDAQAAGHLGWQNYSYRASETKESFSQVLFNALGLPLMKGEQAVNVTINQILRLIYADQLTPGAKLFKHQEKWDSAFMREAVGELLCGIYDGELYEARLDLVVKNKSLETHIARLRSIFQILGQAEQDVPLSGYEEAAQNIASRLDELYESIAQLKNKAILVNPKELKKSEKHDEVMASKLAKASSHLRKTREDIEKIQFELADSQEFIRELKRRRAALDEAQSASEYLGQVKFEVCPCCMATLKAPSSGDSLKCSLCKEELSDKSSGVNYLRMRSELDSQIRESEQNISRRESMLEELNLTIKNLQDDQAILYRSLKGFSKSWSTQEEREIDAANMEIGRLNQELAGLREKEKLRDLLTKLQSERNALNSEILVLQDIVTARENLQAGRRDEVLNLIGRYVAELLRDDLPREQVFMNAQEISIDFGANTAAVNRVSVFSASSLVLLKNSFHMAMLMASCDKDYMRYPRLSILDGIEDGGMEDARSHNFQRLLFDRSSKISAEHQIIYTTAKIAPEFKETEAQIGPTYSLLQKTISIR